MSRHSPSLRPASRQASRVRALASRVAGLEIQIEREGARPLPDSIRLSRLKREKLWLKDQIRLLVRQRLRSAVSRPTAPLGQQEGQRLA